MPKEKQTYDLHPDWRLYLGRFALGVLLVPLLGWEYGLSGTTGKN